MIDTHDTGGHPRYEDKDTMFRYLRVRGNLPAGSIITVEPGVSIHYSSLRGTSWQCQIYFCRFIIEPYLQDPVHAAYINFEVLNKYWEVGGVRIEGKSALEFWFVGLTRGIDNILITKDGYENLTTAVKDVADMEKIINGS